MADGARVDPRDVMGEPRPGRTLVFTGDTEPCDATVAVSQGADLLVHDGTFAGEELALELTISTLGIALGLAVLLRFGLLALVVMFYTFLLIETFPLTADFSRPYAGISLGLVAIIAALSVFGFVASRGDEPVFGRAILD